MLGDIRFLYYVDMSYLDLSLLNVWHGNLERLKTHEILLAVGRWVNREIKQGVFVGVYSSPK